MNFDPLRRLQSKWSVAFVAAAALVLSSCGGGGATSPPSTGPLQLLPGTASLYAGVPYTFNIAGGRPPYLVTSSEQTLLELNFTTDSSQFQVVPRNPGVVDVGLDPNEVPRRSVNVEVRDSTGRTTTNTYNVLQNFFTGYREIYASTCASGAGTEPPQACSGTDTIVTVVPVSNGTLYGNREFQFDRVRGDFQFVVEDPAAVPQLVDRIRIRTDHNGIGFVRVRVANNAPTQVATYKFTDVATGATTDAAFTVVQQAVVDQLSLLPNEITFTGTLSTRCGTGTADVFVFGGTPPYTVQASAGLAVSPTTVANSGGKFQVTAGLTSAPCPPATTVIVTDSRGSAGSVKVTLAPGSGTLPPVTAAPDTIATLLCGQSAQVTVVGGSGSFSATSQHPRITAVMAGTTLTLTRLNGDGATIYPTDGSAVVSDGSSTATVAITATPANCP